MAGRRHLRRAAPRRFRVLHTSRGPPAVHPHFGAARLGGGGAAAHEFQIRFLLALTDTDANAYSSG